LVDFGVGSLLGDDAGKAQNPVRGLTPAFSAPELRAGEEASTQSDVWALGRLLHWLLDQGRQIGAQSQPALLENRQVARHADLQAILDRACASRPEDRYAGVVQLLDDLRRYRQRLPVNARAPSHAYHSARFVQRHWLAVAFGLVGALMLCLALAGAMWQAHQATLERDRASLKAARALSAEQDSLRLANELQQVVVFQAEQLARIDSADMGARLRQDIIERYRDSLASAGHDAATDQRDLEELEQALSVVNFTDLARTSLEHNIFSTALESIDAQFADQPLLRARLLQTVATSMREVGLREQVLRPQQRALAIRREQLGDDHLDTLDSIDHLGLILGRLARLDDQARVYREALAGYRRTVGERDARTLNAMSNLGANYNARGQIEQAEQYFREALSGQREVLGRDHPQTLITTYSLGHMISLQGRHEEALPYHQAALSGRRQLYGDEHPDTLTALNNMGALLIELGRLEDALPFYQQALDGRRSLLGNEHRATLQSINNMGHLLSQMERLEQAQPFVLESLERARVLLGDQHPNTLIYFNNAGRLHLNMDQPVQSEQLFGQAVEGARAVLPEGHWHTASFLAGHAGALRALNRFEDAEAAWLEAYEIFDNVLGREHERTVHTAAELAELYRIWNRDSASPEREARYHQWQERLEASSSKADS
jgi:eukaryotic-like serine/threonine-protein kinase